MSTTIEPTLGRIVYFRGRDGITRPAIIVGVAGMFTLDLYVFGQDSGDDISGYMGHVTHADPEQEPGCFPSWHWMPYQIGQAKKAADREHDAKQMAVAADATLSSQRVRATALELALRTPNLVCHNEVLAAARAYQAHIEGEVIPGTRLISEREKALEDLLRSACAIADRKGEDTAWERFAASVHALGLTGVTARTYRVLPSDIE